MSADGRAFLDTNLFLYAHDPREMAKSQRSREVIEEAGRQRRGVVSTQVMQEFYAVATRKLGMEPLAAEDSLRAMQAFEVVNIHPAIIFDAIGFAVSNRIAFWDALIVAAASAAGCKWILSEDLQHGSRMRGVTIRNPFA
jgi:predicted nucleic acid-binding protein